VKRLIASEGDLQRRSIIVSVTYAKENPIAKQRNTFAKRQREQDKKARTDQKRAKREQKKTVRPVDLPVEELRPRPEDHH